MEMKITFEKTAAPRARTAESQLGFGRYFSDHMFLAEYEARAWHHPRIVPYGPLAMEPGASVFHYGQAMFEGMKAFRAANGGIHLFRPEFHARRMSEGADRLCMPAVPPDFFLRAVEELVRTDESWIPRERGSALYLRPTLIGTESFLGVRPSEKYLFFIITSPVGSYYSEGFSPVKIWIEEESIRAANGGLGAVKAAANYAASLQASTRAKKNNYAQVLWLDAAERKYIEEVGTMNVFFRIGDQVLTPSLDGSILGGATRDCVIRLLQDWGIPVQQRKVSLEEIAKAHDSGLLREVFGTGTAAVVSSVGELANTRQQLVINGGKVGELTQKLLQEITDIQLGVKPDPHGWVKAL